MTLLLKRIRRCALLAAVALTSCARTVQISSEDYVDSKMKSLAKELSIVEKAKLSEVSSMEQISVLITGEKAFESFHERSTWFYYDRSKDSDKYDFLVFQNIAALPESEAVLVAPPASISGSRLVILHNLDVRTMEEADFHRTILKQTTHRE